MRNKLAAFAFSLCTAVHAGEPPTIAQFAEDADASVPALSPDGTKVAYVTRIDGTRALIVSDLVSRDARVVLELLTKLEAFLSRPAATTENAGQGPASVK